MLDNGTRLRGFVLLMCQSVKLSCHCVCLITVSFSVGQVTVYVKLSLDICHIDMSLCLSCYYSIGILPISVTVSVNVLCHCVSCYVTMCPVVTEVMLQQYSHAVINCDDF